MFAYPERITLRSTFLAIGFCVFVCNGAVAEQISAAKPTGKVFIALIIDDLGNQQLPGERAIALDGPVACAIMPHTAYATYLAETAHAAGKEVMLHLPMQPVEMDRIAGPGEISLDNDREELGEILAGDLQSVPHTTGVNNHMGSLITRHPGHMRWLMDELARRGDLFFIDSFTTPDSVAYAMAQEQGIPTARRHVFIDNDQSSAAIAAAFARLKQRAVEQGYAIGIGHPYPATLSYLEAVLPTLNAEGIELVPVTQIINTR
jgi:polysaccharide deacetylase 2 family uncharacterized protein YibQ